MATLTKPTHTATLLFVSAVANKKVRAKIKSGGTKESALEAARSSTAFRPHLAGVADSEIQVSFVKLPVSKCGARLNVQHDYITLHAVFPEGKVNLTASRYRDTMSGDLQRTSEAREFFSRFTNRKGEGSVGDMMNALLAKAKAATSANEFFSSTI